MNEETFTSALTDYPISGLKIILSIDKGLVVEFEKTSDYMNRVITKPWRSCELNEKSKVINTLRQYLPIELRKTLALEFRDIKDFEYEDKSNV